METEKGKFQEGQTQGQEDSLLGGEQLFQFGKCMGMWSGALASKPGEVGEGRAGLQMVTMPEMVSSSPACLLLVFRTHPVHTSQLSSVRCGCVTEFQPMKQGQKPSARKKKQAP